MPTYEIQAPNGKTYQIDGPEGATQEQVKAQVMQQYPDELGGEAAEPERMEPERMEPQSSEAIQTQLTSMMQSNAPAADIIGYIQATGRPLEKADREWLTGEYEQGRTSGNPTQRPFEVAANTEEQAEDPVGFGEAAWKGLQSGALFGFDDEIAGVGGAVGNQIGNWLGMNESTAGFEQVYDEVRRKHNEEKDRAWEERPGAFSVGFAPGMLLGPSFARAGEGANTLRSYAQAGAATGALSGAGNTEGGLVDRGQNALLGGALGAGLGVASKPVVEVAGGVAGRVAERFRPSGNNLDSGLEALALRTNLDPEAMAVRAAELDAAGVPARLVDVVDEQGRGVISAAANRPTPAQEDLARAADTVYADVQDRVANQARERIAPGMPTGRQVAETTEELRGSTMTNRMDDIRFEPVPINDDILAIINTPEGIAALRQSQRSMQFDSDERATVDALLEGVKRVRQYGRGLPEEARRALERSTFSGINLNVDVVDKFAVSLGNRAQSSGNSVGFRMKEAVRNAARNENANYGRAVDDFSAASRTAEAARGEGRFAESDFMRTEPTTFANQVDNAGTVPPRFVDEEGVATRGVTERDALAARAADNVANRAQEGAGQNAMRTAQQLGRGTNQQRRNEALLGQEGADDLRTAMRGEVDRVNNTRYIDPRIGSDTFRRQQQNENGIAGEVIETAASAGFSPTYTMIRAVGRWMRNTGIRDADAERLVRDAIDPARTQDAIAFLVQRGVPKSTARQLTRALGNAATTGGRLPGRFAGGVAGDDRPTNPGSIRTLTTVRRVEEPEGQPVTRVELDQEN